MKWPEIDELARREGAEVERDVQVCGAGNGSSLLVAKELEGVRHRRSSTKIQLGDRGSHVAVVVATSPFIPRHFITAR